MCYPKHNPENEEYGWCRTKVAKQLSIHNLFFSQGNYYEVGRENDHERSWGFCGKDCFLDTDVPSTGILRMKEHIHILSDDVCENFLDISLQSKPEVDYQIEAVK